MSPSQNWAQPNCPLWSGPAAGQEPARGPRAGSSPRWACRVFRDRLSKQIKGVRALKDGGGCFYVLPQAAVAPIGLGERLMGLKHSACSQMEGTRYRTSKCSVIYIFSQSNRHFSFFAPIKEESDLLHDLFDKSSGVEEDLNICPVSAPTLKSQNIWHIQLWRWHFSVQLKLRIILLSGEPNLSFLNIPLPNLLQNMRTVFVLNSLLHHSSFTLKSIIKLYAQS